MEFKPKIDELTATKKILERDIQQKEKELQERISERKSAEEARSILQLAAKKTQQNIEQHFSDIVTKALNVIFDEPMEFVTQFIERRNKTECDLWLKDNKKLRKPRFSNGGGVIDVISFALRLAYRKFEKTRPVLFLDEPFSQLSKKHHPKAFEVLKMLSNEFNLQLIINTHISGIIEYADRSFEVIAGKVTQLS